MNGSTIGPYEVRFLFFRRRTLNQNVKCLLDRCVLNRFRVSNFDFFLKRLS